MKKLMCALALAGLVIPLTAKAEPKIEITKKTDAFSDADINKALEIFWKNCEPLYSTYWPDIVSVSVESSEEYADYRMKRGWKYSIHLAITMADDPKFMPAADSDIGVMAGHTLHYDIGGGKDSGFFAKKRVSQKVCGMKVRDDGADEFQKINEYNFLKR